MAQIPFKDLIKKRIDEEFSRVVEDDDKKIRSRMEYEFPVHFDDGVTGFLIPLDKLMREQQANMTWETRIKALEKRNPGTVYRLEKRYSGMDEQETLYLAVGIPASEPGQK